jgi:threonine/homoserine/homoserine lactone efflux protein
MAKNLCYLPRIMLEACLAPNALFIATTAAILAVPGPTNALLAASGAMLGLRRSLTLIPVVLVAYLGAILAWGCLLAPATTFWPPLASLMRAACALFLAATAMRLWRGTASLSAKTTSPVTTRTITLATLLNPKALLFATGGFPAIAFTQPDAFYATAVVFSVPLLPITLAWIAFGASLGGSVFRISPQTFQRASAIVLAFFSASIGVSTVF